MKRMSSIVLAGVLIASLATPVLAQTSNATTGDLFEIRTISHSGCGSEYGHATDGQGHDWLTHPGYKIWLYGEKDEDSISADCTIELGITNNDAASHKFVIESRCGWESLNGVRGSYQWNATLNGTTIRPSFNTSQNFRPGDHGEKLPRATAIVRPGEHNVTISMKLNLERNQSGVPGDSEVGCNITDLTDTGQA